MIRLYCFFIILTVHDDDDDDDDDDDGGGVNTGAKVTDRRPLTGYQPMPQLWPTRCWSRRKW